MNMKEWKAGIISRRQRIAIPIMTHPGIEMTGTTILKAVNDGTVHYQIVQALAETYPTAAATMMMDLSVEAEAFGAEVHFSENDIPTVCNRLVGDKGSIEKLRVVNLQQKRLPEYLIAAQLAASHITDRPVLAGCIGPFSLAGRLYGMTEIMMDMLIDPTSIHLLLEKCTDFLTGYCRAFKTAGTGGVIVAEPAAGMLSPELCQEFSSTYIRKVVEAVQDNTFILVLHNCGNTNPLLATMQNTKAAALHLGNQCDILAALHYLNKDLLVMGNLDPVGIFKESTPEQVYKATLDLLNKTSKYNNFILSSGCDIPPEVARENLESFFRAWKHFNTN
jgi:uroporphyrinogen decarboxylase